MVITDPGKQSCFMGSFSFNCTDCFTDEEQRIVMKRKNWENNSYGTNRLLQLYIN